MYTSRDTGSSSLSGTPTPAPKGSNTPIPINSDEAHSLQHSRSKARMLFTSLLPPPTINRHWDFQPAFQSVLKVPTPRIEPSGVSLDIGSSSMSGTPRKMDLATWVGARSLQPGRHQTKSHEQSMAHFGVIRKEWGLRKRCLRKRCSIQGASNLIIQDSQLGFPNRSIPELLMGWSWWVARRVKEDLKEYFNATQSSWSRYKKQG